MRKILTFIFVLTLAASVFGGQFFPPVNRQDAIDGAITSTVATVCAGGQTGTLYRSTDYGTNWTSIANATVDNTNITGISIAGGTIFAGGILDGVGKVFKSADWGSSWTDISPLLLDDVYDLYFQDANAGVATVSNAPFNEVRYTINGGTTWSAPNSAPPNGELWTAVTGAGGNVFWIVGNAGSIYKTTNGGNNWTAQTSGTASVLHSVFALDANNAFIVGENNTFLFTTNGGTNWTSVGGVGLSLAGFGVHAVDANTVWIAGYSDGPTVAKLYKLTKSGSTWTSSLVYSLSAATFRGIFLTDNDNVWVAGSATGGTSGLIDGRLTAATVSSIVQQNYPTQNRAPQGATLDLTFTGPNFQIGNWTPGRVVFSGSGITVNSVTRNSKTQLTANVSIGNSAATGNRDITITNIDGSSTLTLNAFLVTLPPTINSVNPSRVYQNWIGTVTLTGDAFQVDPLSAITFVPQTAGATLEIIGATTVVSTTAAVVKVSATSVSDFRVWLNNADGGNNYYDFFVVDSFSPPTFDWMSFNGVTYDATAFPYPPGQLISPTPRIVAVFTDNEQLFNTSSQNTAKIVFYADGSLTGIYEVPSSEVRLESSNARAIIDCQIPTDKSFASSVNTIQAYIENSSTEARLGTARVRIGTFVFKGVPDKVGLAYPSVWNPRKAVPLDLAWKVYGTKTAPYTVNVDIFGIDGKPLYKSGPTATKEKFIYNDPADASRSYKIYKISTPITTAQFFMPDIANQLMYIIVRDNIQGTLDAKIKVMVNNTQ